MSLADGDSGAESTARREKRTAASAVYHDLKRDLMRAAYKPGERLLIEQVAARYGAGVSPVREALNRLSAERLVDREDQRGFSVPPLSIERFRELVKTRCWIEGRALEESIHNRTDAWEESLVIAYHRLSRAKLRFGAREDDAGEPADNSDWEARHRAFHRTLIMNSGSRWMTRFCDELADQVERYRYIALTTSLHLREVMPEHQLILEATIDGDAETAVSHLVDHYKLTLSLYERQVKLADDDA
ncbi:GntR family transcriptional regulator [Acuticoccus sp. M5D2P5]|uniref:GntR family transcriptional regulator n=1 Tax=Acuticoccus kalidii TaxID=2910977 RepID=UPI001F18BC52|nr:GntR family transcriptional regulator [Acuticoccus kalidii]MCF3936256.1 GntR family transcriptional regulator [Acuticoccus kalidii]